MRLREKNGENEKKSEAQRPNTENRINLTY